MTEKIRLICSFYSPNFKMTRDTYSSGINSSLFFFQNKPRNPEQSCKMDLDIFCFEGG